MAELIARYKPGENVPGFAAAQVTAGRFVVISADKTADGDYSITNAGTAGVAVFGVAERDSADTSQSAHSVERRVNVVRRGAIARVVAGGAIAAGGPVKTSNVGKAVAQGGS